MICKCKGYFCPVEMLYGHFQKFTSEFFLICWLWLYFLGIVILPLFSSTSHNQVSNLLNCILELSWKPILSSLYLLSSCHFLSQWPLNQLVGSFFPLQLSNPSFAPWHFQRTNLIVFHPPESCLFCMRHGIHSKILWLVCQTPLVVFKLSILSFSLIIEPPRLLQEAQSYPH